LVAIVTGILNHQYTKRSFEASTTPSLYCYPVFSYSHDPTDEYPASKVWRTTLQILVKNQSSAIQVTDVQVTVTIAVPLAQRFFFGKRKKVSFIETLEDWL